MSKAPSSSSHGSRKASSGNMKGFTSSVKKNSSSTPTSHGSPGQKDLLARLVGEFDDNKSYGPLHWLRIDRVKYALAKGLSVAKEILEGLKEGTVSPGGPLDEKS